MTVNCTNPSDEAAAFASFRSSSTNATKIVSSPKSSAMEINPPHQRTAPRLAQVVRVHHDADFGEMAASASTPAIQSDFGNNPAIVRVIKCNALE